MFVIINSKRIKLQSRANSQIAENSFAIPNLMSFFKFGWDLTEIWPPEGDPFFFSKVVHRNAVISYHAMPFLLHLFLTLAMKYWRQSYHVMWSSPHVILYHVMSIHAMSCHVMSCHFMHLFHFRQWNIGIKMVSRKTNCWWDSLPMEGRGSWDGVLKVKLFCILSCKYF